MLIVIFPVGLCILVIGIDITWWFDAIFSTHQLQLPLLCCLLFEFPDRSKNVVRLHIIYKFYCQIRK